MRSQILLLFVFLMFGQEIFAQEELEITRIDDEFTLDGVVNEPFWQTIEPVEMVMYKPNFGSEPTEKSEVRIAYNDDYILVSAMLFTKDPSTIMATSKNRDENSTGNDRFTILFDSFNDKENGLGFSTTPEGLRYDFTISKDANPTSMTDRVLSSSWNTFWDVETTKDDKGWYTEMRIPLSSLRFKSTDGNVTMGVICLRDIPQNNEQSIYPAIEPKYGIYSYYKPSKAKEVSFSNIKSKKPFYVAPYILGGIQQENVLNSEGDAYELKTDFTPEKLSKLFTKNIGLDIKYGLTNNLTLDLTYNTDFAQVEADDQQVNLTRFSLFFSEKRTFFQERSSIFNFDFETTSNSLFYSRRIGLSDEGEQVPIIGGARVTGMAGKWDIGFINMQTEDLPSGGLNSENFGVLRLRRNVINANSYVGGIVTSRTDFMGKHNLAYGADAIVRVFSNDYLNAKIASTASDSTENKVLSPENSQIYLNWTNSNIVGLGYGATYTRSGKSFDPQVGFMTRKDYSYYHGELFYGFIGDENSKLYDYGIGLQSSQYRHNENDVIESGETQLEARFSLKTGYMFDMMLYRQVENVTEDFPLGDLIVPAHKYKFNNAKFIIMTPRTKPFFNNAIITIGKMYDGKYLSVAYRPQWNLSSTVQLSGSYSYSRINFEERNEIFESHLVKLSTLLMFSTKMSFSSYIQYSSASNSIITNMRLRYNPKEGNDLYLVYNDGRNTDLNREDPGLPNLASRTIMLKYTYTFTL